MRLNEIKWTKSYARPQMNYSRSAATPEYPDECISLIKRYLLIVPYLPPTIPKDLCLKTICHRDLHLDNIFVDPETEEITSIIDWQSISISEIFLQNKVPPMLPLSKTSGSADTLEATSLDSQLVEDTHNSTDLLGYYLNLTEAKTPHRWAAINDLPSSLVTDLVSLVCGVWSRNDIFSFRHALIAIVAHWKDLVPVSTCPISFTDQELELHNDEKELLEGLGTVLHQLQDENLIPLGGRVLRTNYEQAQAVNNGVKKMFIDMAEGDEQKDLHAKLWPY